MIRILLLGLIIVVGLIGYNHFKVAALSPNGQFQEVLETRSISAERLEFLCQNYPALAASNLQNRQLTITGTVQTAFTAGLSQRKLGLQIYRKGQRRILIGYDLDRDPAAKSFSSNRQVRFLIEDDKVLLMDTVRRRRATLFVYRSSYTWAVMVKSITPTQILLTPVSYPTASFR